MTDPVAQLALSKLLGGKVKEWEADAKARLSMLPGERTAAVIGTQVLGHVGMTKGRKTARVVNEAAFLAYVKSRWPGEVEVSESVNPAFQKRLLDEAAKLGAFVDSEGVVIDGIVDVSQSDPYPSFKAAEDADIIVAGLLAKGALNVNGLKELEANE